MKILQVNNYHFRKGGSESVYFETSKLLEEHGHEVIHFSVNDINALDSKTKKYFVDPHEFMDNTVVNKILSIPKFFYSFESAKKLKILLEKEKPDIVHLHIFYSRLTSSILPVLKKYNVPVVMTVHEYKMLCPMYLFMDNNGNICEKCANGNTLHCIINKCNKGNLAYSIISSLEAKFRDWFFPYEKYVDHFIMVSEFIKNKHLAYKPEIKDKTSIIHNFVDSNRFQEKIILGEYYLFFGRLSVEKGILELIDKWIYLDEKIKLIIVGTGPLENTIKEHIQENNLNNILLVGAKYDEELLQYVQNAKYVIFPSKVYETFGLGILESFACAKPVIAANIGNFSNLVEENKTGFLFNLDKEEDLIKKINQAEALSLSSYIEMSKNTTKIASLYSKKEYYHKIFTLYNLLINNKRK
ncbi:MAG: glycosyltransferase [Sulfurimonas sp.]|nr:glycosyltransferase [Sulfurimonas sp.]